MWLRPRTEMLPVDVHWWRWADDPHDSGIAIGLGVGNLALLAMAGWSLARIGRLRYAGMWLTYIALRTILLAAIATPEPRYVLECYPVVLALAGAALAKATQKVYSGQARQG